MRRNFSNPWLSYEVAAGGRALAPGDFPLLPRLGPSFLPLTGDKLALYPVQTGGIIDRLARPYSLYSGGVQCCVSFSF